MTLSPVSSCSYSSMMQEDVLMLCLLSLDSFTDLVHDSMTIFLCCVFHSSHKTTLISRIQVRMERQINNGVEEEDMVEVLQEVLGERQLHPPDKRQSLEAGPFSGFSAKI